jgi:uncharacterized damage-inducible protein DinB
MDAMQQKQLTVGGFLPWVGMTLDYTDQIAALIPEDKLDWRPEDPSGHFQFSLGEIAMHIADARRMFARQLSGSDSEEGYWSEGPDDQGVWKFNAPGGKQAILDSLAAARDELNAYIYAPAKSYLETTEGTRKAYEKTLQQMREQGADTEDVSARGPANIVRVMMAVVAHEAGHRGALQTLLRQLGVNAKDV